MKDRSVAIDVLRIVMTVFVIGIHTMCSGTYAPNSVEAKSIGWINEIFHMAVPMFIMISATCMVPSVEQPLAKFYSKRFSRLLAPFAAFSCFFVFIRLFRDGESWQVVGADILRGSPYYHLWYVPMLCCMVMFAPLCVRIVRELPWYCSLGFAVAVAFWMPRTAIMWFYVSNISYMTIGLFCSRYSERVRNLRFGRAIGIVSLALGVLLINYNGLCTALEFRNSVPGSLRWPMPVGFIYFGILCLFGNYTSGGPWIARLAALTFGVYLVHPAFKGIAKLLCLPLAGCGVMYYFVVFAVTTGLAFGCIDILSHVRCLSFWVGLPVKRSCRQ